MQTLTIERLGADGSGIAADGQRVPFTLPGERVELDESGATTLLVASAERAVPPCRHFGTCGGCAMQHASVGFLGEWKRAGVVRALAARGIEAAADLVQAAPAHARRRAVFAGRRTRKSVIVGFHRRRSDAVFSLEECPLLRPALVAAMPALAAVTALGATRTRPLRLAAAHGPAGIDLDIHGGRMLDLELRQRLAQLAEDHDLARLTWEGESVALRRPPVQDIGGIRVVPPPGAFLQPTEEGGAALASLVRAAVGDAGPIADLFAGCGTLSLPLGRHTEVHAVEGDHDMLAALDAAWRQTPGLRRVSTETRDLFRRPLQRSELERFAAVVLDPPRAGAEAQCRALAGTAGRIRDGVLQSRNLCARRCPTHHGRLPAREDCGGGSVSVVAAHRTGGDIHPVMPRPPECRGAR